MSTTYIRYPSNSGGGDGVATYDTFADFPPSASDGDLAIALDTHVLYEFNLAIVTWQPIASPSTILSIGTIDSVTAAANGASISGNALIMQSASSSKPGLVNNTTQTFSGNKTMSGTLNVVGAVKLDSLTIAGAVITDASGNLSSIALLPVANGGTNSGAALNNNRVMSSVGGAIVEAAAITAARALISDANGIPTQSVTTSAELAFVNGVTSSIQNQLNAKQSTTLTSAHILVGNVSNLAADVAMSGAISIDNAGLTAYAGTVPLNKGGTGVAAGSANAAFNALSPMTTLGDIIYGGASGVGTRLAGNTTTTKKFVTQTGDGVNSVAPSWGVLAAADIPLTNTHILVGNGSGVAVDVAVSGDATMANTGALTIGANKISNAKLAQMATLTIKGNNTGGTADPIDLTVSQVNTMLGAITSLTGDVTASGPGASAATIGANKVTNAMLATVSTATFKGRTTGGTGNVEDLTATQATALLNAFVGDSGSGGTKGLVPAPASGSAAAGKYLAADGTFSTPPAARVHSYELGNLGLATSVATNAMTVALKQADGSSDPDGSNPVVVGFRSSTANTGGFAQRSVTAATSVVISSGATLGLASGQAQYIYVYAIDNAGTLELAVSGNKLWDEGTVQNTTIMSGSATSNQVLYSTTARTGVAVRLIGRIKSNQVTSGTYATGSTEVSVIPFQEVFPRSQVQLVTSNGHGSTNTKIRRFLTTQFNYGTAITYADSSTAGGSFTINEAGIYAISYSDIYNSASNFGLSVNSSQLTTNIASITLINRLSISTMITANNFAYLCWTGFLNIGDVVRAHDNGTADGTAPDGTQITFVKVSQ